MQQLHIIDQEYLSLKKAFFCSIFIIAVLNKSICLKYLPLFVGNAFQDSQCITQDKRVVNFMPITVKKMLPFKKKKNT